MNNESGLELKVGDLVWTIDEFECLYVPYRIALAPHVEGKSVFTNIIAFNLYEKTNDRNKYERMNVRFLSRTHPLGWVFIVPDDKSHTLFAIENREGKFWTDLKNPKYQWEEFGDNTQTYNSEADALEAQDVCEFVPLTTRVVKFIEVK